ncbi:MAG: hypothetical protein JWR12_2610 [Mucilaginibacter sp.]|nr:hypothetical protein [Mucilaginibacter sp.]
MFKKTALALSALLISSISYCQIDHLIVPSYVRISIDPIESKKIVNSLESFLKQSVTANKDNTLVANGELLETSCLLDEIKGMENGIGADKKNFFKCYLTNVVQLDSINYTIQIAYSGVKEDTSVLRASFKLNVKKQADGYSFSSPLKTNTANWKVKNIYNCNLYYKIHINMAIIANYVKKMAEFDKKLNAPVHITQMYLCGDFPTLLDLLGVTYKLDYNGIKQSTLTSFENNINLRLVGADDSNTQIFDIHDLWHERLHRVVPVSIINKPVDEGCAYLYGGSWGISWKDIFKQFKTYEGIKKDWLTTFNDNKNFSASPHYHLYVSYVINALLVKKIEKEEGFSGVIALLSCGKYQPDNNNYFLALNKIAGINKSNFNAVVEQLVKDEN